MAAALPCSAPDCPYTTMDAVDYAATVQDKIAVLRIHADTVHGVPTLQHRIMLAPPQEPRWILLNSAQAQMYVRWEVFKSKMGITTGVSMWLFNCLDEELGDAVLQANTNPAPKDMSEQAHLLSIMSLAVKKESKLVQRIKLGRTSSPLGYPSETTWLH